MSNCSMTVLGGCPYNLQLKNAVLDKKTKLIFCVIEHVNVLYRKIANRFTYTLLVLLQLSNYLSYLIQFLFTNCSYKIDNTDGKKKLHKLNVQPYWHIISENPDI